MNVVIMRGIPGAGKSRWAKAHFTQSEIISADQFRYDSDGNYRFDPKDPGRAHRLCLTEYVARLGNRRVAENLVVDNTNCFAWEIAPYYQLALALTADTAEVKIVQVHEDPLTAALRNTHNVPVSTVLRMHQNLLLERLPGHWDVEHVVSR